MTDTEKILNLLEINEKVPCIVVNENGNVITSNTTYSKIIGAIEPGKKFINLFDKNLGLLVENNIIDAITFKKIQKRNVAITKDEQTVDFNLILSPFALNEKNYVYIVFYNGDFSDKVFVYPTADNGSMLSKYDKVVEQFASHASMSIIERKNFQYEIDIHEEPIGIIENKEIIHSNKIFKDRFKLDYTDTSAISFDKLYNGHYLDIIKFVLNELPVMKSTFIIEKIIADNSNLTSDKIYLLPLASDSEDSEIVLYIGDLDAQNLNVKFEQENKAEDKNLPSNQNRNDNLEISNLDNAVIIYDKNNFDILEANKAAAELYQYDIEILNEMNITQLFLPEDMQKILLPADESGKNIYQQIKSDGTKIDVNVERKDVTWNNIQACIETISVNQPEEEVIELSEYQKEKNNPEKLSEDRSINTYDIPKENLSNFLSSLFHELLTPVNVILGFVQEIIDSIDNPTEEQEESSQIIKDNQQILLQAMNTAVQFAQLEENKIDLKSDEFDINNYLVDLEDSYSRIADEENVKVSLTEIPDSLTLNHDRSKLLAAISYFIKFAIKLTESSNIFIALQDSGNEFQVHVKDSEDNLSEKFSRNLLEIFNSSSLNFKKNYGISPITIRLARKLCELLTIKIDESIDFKGRRSISLITNKVFNISEADMDRKPLIENVEIIEAKDIDEDKESIQEEETVNETTIPSPPDTVVEKIDNVSNGIVDDKIIEDIHKEEEITTEEIATVEKKTEEVKSISNLSCLFIDDNIDTQLLFKSQMRDFKLLKICSNFTEALPLLTKYNFDLIIVDVNLNDTYNGLDALKIIRQFNNYKSTPIIAVTAYAFEGDRQKFINFGFTDYIIKPIFRDHVLKSLELVIN